MFRSSPCSLRNSPSITHCHLADLLSGVISCLTNAASKDIVQQIHYIVIWMCYVYSLMYTGVVLNGVMYTMVLSLLRAKIITSPRQLKLSDVSGILYFSVIYLCCMLQHKSVCPHCTLVCVSTHTVSQVLRALPHWTCWTLYQALDVNCEDVIISVFLEQNLYLEKWRWMGWAVWVSEGQILGLNAVGCVCEIVSIKKQILFYC